MKPIKKEKITVGTKAKARLRLANRQGKLGNFIFADCTVTALAVNNAFGAELFTVKLDSPIYDIVDKRTKEYEVVGNEVKVTNLYE